MGVRRHILTRKVLSENLQIKMFVVPTILITSPLFEHDDRFLPRITVTRDESDIDQSEVEENILNMEILDEGEMNLMGSAIGESRSIFPDSLLMLQDPKMRLT